MIYSWEQELQVYQNSARYDEDLILCEQLSFIPHSFLAELINNIN